MQISVALPRTVARAYCSSTFLLLPRRAPGRTPSHPQPWRFPMRRFTPLLLSLVATACFAGAALACHVGGNVYCDGNGMPLAGIRIDVVATDGTDYARY